MKHYQHIKKDERNEIVILLRKGHSLRSIAVALARSPSTISREIKQNSLQLTHVYRSSSAQNKSYVRRHYAKYQGKKISENPKLLKYIMVRLKKHWSPDVISGRMRREGKPYYASKTAIYGYCYSAAGQSLCKYLPAKHYDPKKHHSKASKKFLIPFRVSIKERSKKANLREEYGHFEADAIVSTKKYHTKTALSVLYERKAKYCDLRKIPSLKPSISNQALGQMLANFTKVKSLTFDNGIENQKHYELKNQFNLQTYFCDSYSSWQKGGIEQTNGLIRKFIPKGSDLSRYSAKQLQKIVQTLNQKPRKSLGYLTPQEVMEQNQLLTKNQTKNSLDGCNIYAKLKLIKKASVALRG